MNEGPYQDIENAIQNENEELSFDQRIHGFTTEALQGQLDELNRQNQNEENQEKIRAINRLINQRARKAAMESQAEQNAQLQKQEQEENEQRKDDIDRRMKLKQSILGNYGGQNLPQEGTLDRMAYQAQLSPEGVAGAAIADILVFAFELIFNTHYIRQKMEFNEALKKEAEALAQGETLRLVYQPDENGDYPLVYVVDPKTGEIDFSEVYENGEAPRYAQRINGYIPEPKFTEGLVSAFDEYTANMLGGNRLNAEQKARAFGLVEAAAPEMKQRNDVMRDREAMRLAQMRQQQRPKP